MLRVEYTKEVKDKTKKLEIAAGLKAQMKEEENE